MKDKILANLVGARNALEGVTVCGKMNLANLGGAIVVLEEVINTLKECDIVEPKQKEESAKN